MDGDEKMFSRSNMNELQWHKEANAQCLKITQKVSFTTFLESFSNICAIFSAKIHFFFTFLNETFLIIFKHCAWTTAKKVYLNIFSLRRPFYSAVVVRESLQARMSDEHRILASLRNYAHFTGLFNFDYFHKLFQNIYRWNTMHSLKWKIRKTCPKNRQWIQ